MGLVGQLLTFPLAPLRGTNWVLQQVLETAEREYYDPAPVRAALSELERQLLNGDITEEEFDRREDELLAEFTWRTEQQRRLNS
ncbi:gas vesicle protein GvpG [Streptomyces oceani]|uniref:Gas vesicle protein n=1 Tax=Streptomyces oceani TaxID=1075402 RepID=A0A1E7KPA9_9ACTN|nr:gas vesicle protein GvpG [Streptomyces oceani]OEV05775.1 gas vesicle protein [Streptomyces oceani]